MKIHDESIEHVIALAEDAIMEGDHTNGRHILENVLFDEPGYPKVHASLGWMYHYYVQNESMAERHYQLAIHFDKDYEYPYNGLTDLYRSNQNFDGLENLMTKALESEKIEKDFVFGTLGNVYERKGDFNKAIEFYCKIESRLSIIASNSEFS